MPSLNPGSGQIKPGVVVMVVNDRCAPQNNGRVGTVVRWVLDGQHRFSDGLINCGDGWLVQGCFSVVYQDPPHTASEEDHGVFEPHELKVLDGDQEGTDEMVKIAGPAPKLEVV